MIFLSLAYISLSLSVPFPHHISLISTNTLTIYEIWHVGTNVLYLKRNKSYFRNAFIFLFKIRSKLYDEYISLFKWIAFLESNVLFFISGKEKIDPSLQLGHWKGLGIAHNENIFVECWVRVQECKHIFGYFQVGIPTLSVFAYQDLQSFVLVS